MNIKTCPLSELIAAKQYLEQENEKKLVRYKDAKRNANISRGDDTRKFFDEYELQNTWFGMTRNDLDNIECAIDTEINLRLLEVHKFIVINKETQQS